MRNLSKSPWKMRWKLRIRNGLLWYGWLWVTWAGLEMPLFSMLRSASTINLHQIRTYQHFVTNFPKLLFDALSVFTCQLLLAGWGFRFLFNWWNYTPWWSTDGKISSCAYGVIHNFLTCGHRLRFCKQLTVNFVPRSRALRLFLWQTSWLEPYHRICC